MSTCVVTGLLPMVPREHLNCHVWRQRRVFNVVIDAGLASEDILAAALRYFVVIEVTLSQGEGEIAFLKRRCG